MPNKYIFPYSKHSEGAKALSEKAGWPIITIKSTIPPGSIVFNWGSGENATMWETEHTVFNKASAVRKAINKVSTFECLKAANVPHPEWTTNPLIAFSWGGKVCARSELEGKDGEGLAIIEGVDQFSKHIQTKLFTKFEKAHAEYRVNTTTEKCVGVQRKVRMDGAPATGDIKTGSQGYGFHLCSMDEIPYGIRPIAKDALKALGLNYGGVDLIITDDGRILVLEVNTAPQLTPSMVAGFAEELPKLVG